MQWKARLEVLGVMLDQRGTTQTSNTHRLAKAEGVYGSLSKKLRDPRAPVGERLAAWGRGPVASAMYGAGGWAMNRDSFLQLRRWENKPVRSFLRIKRAGDEEGIMELNRKTNMTIYNAMSRHQTCPIYIKRVEAQPHLDP